MQLQTTYKQIWQVSYPLILGNIAQTVINITDSVFLGKVNQDVFDASAIAGLMFFLMFMIGFAFGNGAQIIVARRAGEKRNDLIGEIIDHSIYLFLILSVILFLIIQFLFPVILAHTLNSKEIIVACEQYFAYRSWGIFFMMLNIVFRAFYVGIAKTKILSWNIGVMAIVNGIFCYLLIFGNYGFPQMSIAGAALASNIAEIASTIIFVAYTFYRKYHLQYSFFRFKKFYAAIFKTITDLSMPMVLQHIFAFGGWLLLFLFIEKLGKYELTISNLVRLVYIVITTPIWAYAAATNTLVSNIIGQGKSNEIVPLVKKIIFLSVGTSLIIVISIVFLPQFILSLFNSDMQLVSDSVNTLYVVTSAMLPLSISTILLSTVSGIGKTRASMMIEILAICCYLIYVYLVTIVWRLPVEVAWISEMLYWLLAGTLSLWYLNKTKWEGRVI